MNRLFTLLLSSFMILLLLQIGCDTPPVVDASDDRVHVHGGADALHWPKQNVEHDGYLISLGHHGNHWHAGDKIEPAVSIVKSGEDIGDAKIVCQLVDGDKLIGSAVEMIFEPKTEAEPAHFAGAKLEFPAEEKMFSVKFEVAITGSAKTFTETIEVSSGH